MRPRPGTRPAVRVLLAACLPLLAAPRVGADPARRTAHEQADQLAAEALRQAAGDPVAAVALARRALALTSDFVPTEFVQAGRRGEIVEDAYVAARGSYRRHRSVLYRALGECLALAGQPVAAARYLRRAHLLDPDGGSLAPLAAALAAAGRGWDALRLLLGASPEGLTPETRLVAERAADAVGLPSLQTELDRARLEALKAEPRPVFRAGPIAAPERARLSSGALLRFDDGELALVIYVAESSCRTCSADLEALQRTAAATARVLVAGEDPADDRALRQALRLYRRDFTVVNGPRLAQAFELSPPAALVVARGGWSGAVVSPPFELSLPPVLAVFAVHDLREGRPRRAWNGRPVERPQPTLQPALLPEGFAPGEDEPAPVEFDAALNAYREGRYSEALRLFAALEQAGDGFLLPPEARLNRALCLMRLGRRAEARTLLLRTGDSRFQDAVDRALEQQ